MNNATEVKRQSTQHPAWDFRKCLVIIVCRYHSKGLTSLGCPSFLTCFFHSLVEKYDTRVWGLTTDKDGEVASDMWLNGFAPTSFLTKASSYLDPGTVEQLGDLQPTNIEGPAPFNSWHMESGTDPLCTWQVQWKCSRSSPKEKCE